MFQRDSKLDLFQPQNPEYELVNIVTNEAFRIVSPHIIYYPYDSVTTERDQDDYDDIMGEAEENYAFFKPVQIYAYVETNPIIDELTRLGLEQIEEINVYANIDEVTQRLSGRAPRAGDFLRISYIERQKADRVVFYKVATIQPVDMYHWRHVNYSINCEQTDLSMLPEDLRNKIRTE